MTLTAKPNAGCAFSSWSGAASGSVNPTAITMNGNKTVTANLVAARSITGQWDFDYGDLRATVGLPLEYFNPAQGTGQAATQFGNSTHFGLPLIEGQQAKVLRFGGATAKTIGYLCRHGAVANGGGSRVNRWTLLMDLLVPADGHGQWFSFGQIDDLANVSDEDLFINWEDRDAGAGEVGGIGISGQYTADDRTTYLRRGQWHRVAFAVDCTRSNAAGEGLLRKYINGVKFGEQRLGVDALDGRFALRVEGLILFADDDGESQTAYFNSIQARDYAMSDVEIATLGGPSATGLQSQAPRLLMAYINGIVTLSWDPTVAGYTLEMTGSLRPPIQWTPVSGVANNQVTVPMQGTTRFYRLRK